MEKWQQHYHAMKRWKVRALSVANGKVEQAENGWIVEGTEADDFAKAYFIWAHSMRDWLIKTGKVERTRLDQLLGNFGQWKNVRDLANKSKHAVITRASIDPNWNSGVKMDLNALLRGEMGVEPYVSIGGRYTKLVDAILETDNMWDEIVQELKLDVSVQ